MMNSNGISNKDGVLPDGSDQFNCSIYLKTNVKEVNNKERNRDHHSLQLPQMRRFSATSIIVVLGSSSKFHAILRSENTAVISGAEIRIEYGVVFFDLGSQLFTICPHKTDSRVSSDSIGRIIQARSYSLPCAISCFDMRSTST